VPITVREAGKGEHVYETLHIGLVVHERTATPCCGRHCPGTQVRVDATLRVGDSSAHPSIIALACAPSSAIYTRSSVQGTFTVELYSRHAPKTTKNFAELARRHFYDGIIFHRIVPGFVIQGGDPTGTGRGGDSIYGGAFEDEIHKELKHTGAGILSMANSGPNSNRSQFFVTLGPTPWLDGKHTVFGRVCGGMGVIERISRVATGAGDRPKEDVKIVRASVLDG
jgi:peptidyl-prolyl cis-trans isomerase-like 1